jgi:hypothetical protein
MSRPFAATWPTRCARDECPDPRIREGEIVRYGDDDRIEHEACPEPAPPPNVCPSCHMALPLTGVCDDC